MNNEVLRRKMFNTVLRDRNQPAGILASSSELAGAVQRRAGGVNQGDAQYMQAIGQLAQQGDKATLQNIFADTRLSSTVRNAAREALGSLATNRNTSSAPSTGTGIGQGILDVAADQNRKFIDSVKTAASNDVDRVSSLLDFLGVKGSGEVARPIETEGPGIAALIGQGIKKMGSDLRSLTDPIDRKLGYLTYDETEDKGLPTGEATVPESFPIDFVVTEDDEFGNIGPDGKSVPTDYDFGEEGGLGSAPTVPKTVAEEVSETAISSKTPAQEQAEQDAGAASASTTTTKSGSSMDKALQLVEDRKNEEQQSKFTLAKTTDAGTASNTAATILGVQENENISNKKKAEETDALLGIVPAGDKATPKERMEARKALITELLGEDKAKDIRTDANYNLMMTGLMIAAGESSNALTNIAKGAAAGLQKYGDVVGEKADEKNKTERAIALQAIEEVRGEIATEKQRDYDSMVRAADQQFRLNLQEIQDVNALKRLDRQLSAAEQRQIAEFDFKEKLAEQSFEENILMLGIKGDQAAALQEDAQIFKRELAEFAQNADSDDLKMVKALQAAGNLSFEDAYARFKATSAGRSTDEQRRFEQLIKAGVPASQALLYAGAGVTKALIDELGIEGAEQKLQSVVGGGSQIPSFETRPPDADLQKLVDSGVNQIQIGGSTFYIGEAETKNNP